METAYGKMVPNLKKKHELVGVATSKENKKDIDSLEKRIDISRFSKFQLLINTTARILKLHKRFKRDAINEVEIKAEDIHEAKRFWTLIAQKQMHEDVRRGRYVKLLPKVQDGLLVVGGRTERWVEATWNKQEFVLLPKEHRLSNLIAVHEHIKGGHLGVASTVSLISSKYWIIGVTKLVNKIIYKCVGCKRKFKRRAEQIMSPLPIERIKPSPPFLNIGVDYFGPYEIKGEVQKRTRSKGYGVILTCLCSRAVYVDIAYSG